jgi:hypothetical protein
MNPTSSSHTWIAFKEGVSRDVCSPGEATASIVLANPLAHHARPDVEVGLLGRVLLTEVVEQPRCPTSRSPRIGVPNQRGARIASSTPRASAQRIGPGTRGNAMSRRGSSSLGLGDLQSRAPPATLEEAHHDREDGRRS